ncbi:MAG TPA: hypothetical protein VHO47_01365 [Candidatus Babeliales bacterium]|nr:hypothetical protein [Candidatus Babeliales bacterium]
MINKYVAAFLPIFSLCLNAMEIERQEKKEELFKQIEAFKYISPNHETIIKRTTDEGFDLYIRDKEPISLGSIWNVSFSVDSKYLGFINGEQFIIYDLQDNKKIYATGNAKIVNLMLGFTNKKDSMFSTCSTELEFALSADGSLKQMEGVGGQFFSLPGLLGIYLSKGLSICQGYKGDISLTYCLGAVEKNYPHRIGWSKVVTPDGSMVAGVDISRGSGEKDRDTVIVIDFESNDQDSKKFEHKSGDQSPQIVAAIGISPNKKHLMTQTNNGYVHLWDIKKNTKLWTSQITDPFKIQGQNGLGKIFWSEESIMLKSGDGKCYKIDTQIFQKLIEEKKKNEHKSEQ